MLGRMGHTIARENAAARVYVRAGNLHRARDILLRWYVAAGGSTARVAADRGLPLSTLHAWRRKVWPDLEAFRVEVAGALEALPGGSP